MRNMTRSTTRPDRGPRAGLGFFRWLATATLFAVLAGAGVFSAACNSPFIPIPPPGDPTFEPVTVQDGMGGMKMVWQVRGGPRAGMASVKVSVWNDSLGVGVIARALPDGSYLTGPIDGALNDRVEIHYQTADKMEQSPVLCRLLTAGLAQQPCPAVAK